MSIKTLVALMTVGLTLSSGAAMAAAAGEITLFTGRGTIASPDGQVRSLSKGASVYSREYVSTGSNSFANIKFTDGSAVLIKPNTRFLIEKYSYLPRASAAKSAPQSGSSIAQAPVVSGSSAFFRLFKGGFRAVSGLVGRNNRGEYRVSTPVATIGIRGTDYTAIVCDDSCAADPLIMKKINVNPLGGLIAKVQHGGINVTTDAVGKISSLKSYRAIAQALGLTTHGLMKVANAPRGRLIRVENGGSNSYDVNQDETLFFPEDGLPEPLDFIPPDVDSGLSHYNPNEMCQ